LARIIFFARATTRRRTPEAKRLVDVALDEIGRDLVETDDRASDELRE